MTREATVRFASGGYSMASRLVHCQITRIELELDSRSTIAERVGAQGECISGAGLHTSLGGLAMVLRRLLSAVLLIALAIASILPSSAAATGTPTPELAKTIEDQQRFRAEFGLRDDRAYVERVGQDAPSPQWGVPLSGSEEADLAQRVRIQDSLGSLKDFLATLPSFGGLYIDQKAGGAIDIAFTAGEPPAALATQVAMLAPREATFRYTSVRYSLAELKSVQRDLEAMMVEGTPTGRAIKSVSTNVSANVVEVGVASENRSTAG